MKIKVAKRAWQTAKMNNDWQRFANYFCSHYPMDKQMAKYFREAMKSTNDSAMKWKASFSKSTPKRRTTAKKRTTTAKRRTTTKKRYSAPKRRTSTTKRWTAKKRYGAPKRRSYKRAA